MLYYIMLCYVIISIVPSPSPVPARRPLRGVEEADGRRRPRQKSVSMSAGRSARLS